MYSRCYDNGGMFHEAKPQRLLILLFCAFVCATVASGSTIDQQSTLANGTFGPGSSPGQSFTPTLSGIDFAVFSLSVTFSASIHVNLFSGDGYGGTLLGTTGSQVIGFA